MSKEEGFLPGFEPEENKDNTTGEKVEGVKITYATREERVHCQYCEDVGICEWCERGKEELSKLK